METKKCRKCGKVKGVEEFYKGKNYINKLRSTCKECLKEYGKEYRKLLPISYVAANHKLPLQALKEYPYFYESLKLLTLIKREIRNLQKG